MNLPININYKVIILFVLLIICIIAALILSTKRKKLDSIKAKVVGDGQHGTDRWLNDKEKSELFTKVIIPHEIKDMSNEWTPGRIVDYNPKTREALVDTSSTHAAVVAPTEVGKTSRYYMLNVQYNLMAGCNMILPAIKKEVMDLTEGDAKYLGYETFTIDFANPEQSCGFDFFDDINRKMQSYLLTGNIKDKAEAETLAGKLAEDIVTSRDKSNSNTNQFFIGASEGVLHSVILLNSMFGKKEEVHFSSVRSIIQNILSMKDATANGKNKDPKIIKLLKGMPDDFGPKKHIGAAFAASNETEDNIYSSVLDDLRPMNNTLAEQIISCPSKKEAFSYKSLIDKKCILYIHCPESKPEFFVFFKLIIKKICTQLALEALNFEGEKLPKPVKVLWDEFGVSPQIQKMDNEMSLDRGKGILFDLIYQDDHQLIDKYGEHIQKVIEHQCGINIILGIASTDTEQAKKISEACGNQTIQSGSVSVSRDNSLDNRVNTSYTEQMIDRPLITAGEVMRLESSGRHLVMKRGNYPFLANYTQYFKDGWNLLPRPRPVPEKNDEFYSVTYMNFDDLQNRMNTYKNENGYVIEQSTIEIQYFPSENEYINGTGGLLEDIINKINTYTNNDPTPIELLKNKEYLSLIEYMKKYKSTISRYELQELIAPLAD